MAAAGIRLARLCLTALFGALVVLFAPSLMNQAQAISPPPTPAPGEEPALCVGPNGPAEAACRWTPTDNNLIVRLEGDADGAVEVIVVYANGEEGPFRKEAAVNGGRYELHLGRLRAETTYEFRVYLTGPAGEAVPKATGYFTTGPLPEGLQRAEVDVRDGEPSSELTFMDFNVHASDEGPAFYGLVAIDGGGEIVWYAETGETNAMAQKPDGNIVFLEHGFGLREINPIGETVRAVESPCKPDIQYHHEVELLPDGRVLTLGYDIRDRFADSRRLQVGDTIWVWDPEKGSLREAWNALDFISASLDRAGRSSEDDSFIGHGCGLNLLTEDWTYANSAKAARNGDIIVSLRQLDQVLSISHDFQRVNWRLGGARSDFTFPEPEDQFYHQHMARQLPNGNILLFDNGHTRPDDEGGEYSRALELELDFDAMTAIKVWEYQASNVFSICCSSVERLPNGNTLVLFSPDPADDDDHATLVEVDAEENDVWEVRLSADGQRVIYHAYPADSILGEQRVQ